ncbi:MAG: hypothetical protein VW547_06425 [Alphaproteobacteria bacterium]
MTGSSGGLSPVRNDGDFRFRDIDVARARLIDEFRPDLELGNDALDVVLPLIEQLHGLRRELQRMAEAVSAEPNEVRQRIAAALRR